MTISELTSKLPEIIDIACQLFTSLAIFATVVSRALAKPDVQTKVGKIADKGLELMQYLPTIGVNPKTKQMKEALKEARGELVDESSKAA